MDPNQQQLLLTGAAGGSTYIEEVFSTYPYKGNETARTLATGIDNTKGALAWVKKRNDTADHQLADTVRGANKVLKSNENDQELSMGNRITGFTNNGFTIGTGGEVNGTNAYDYVGWNFRKQKGFFDIVTWVGDGNSGRQLAHNLGSVPGMVWVKQTDGTEDWTVYHRNTGASKKLILNTEGAVGSTSSWNSVRPTSTYVELGGNNAVNQTGKNYVAYIFAGGPSPNMWSVDCGGNEGIDVGATSDLNLGTGRFCIEGWVDLHNAIGVGSPSYGRLFQLDGPTGNNDNDNLQITMNPSTQTFHIQSGSQQVLSVGASRHIRGRWVHFALTRYSNTMTLYINGIPVTSDSWTGQFTGNGGSPRVRLGYLDTSNNGVFNGRISNFRITTNEEVYTGPFEPPTEPLTTSSQVISSSNVKLLCCNQSTVTGSTVTPATITSTGTPTASVDNPFSDPSATKFGENGDQDIIKCGGWTGNGNSATDAPHIYVGWEPQWILVKETTLTTEQWWIFDNYRGIPSNGQDASLTASTNASESTWDLLDLEPKGFKLKTSDDKVNGLNKQYIYMAIRRPDQAVAKPPETGTDVFNLTVGTGGAPPQFVTGFAPDYMLHKEPGTNSNWHTGCRLTGNDYWFTNNSNAAAQAHWLFGATDYPNGYGETYYGSFAMGWSWKRYAGFDVVTYKGNGVSDRKIPHNLGRAPEMMWLKPRDSTGKWNIYHKDLNGGTNPAQNYLLFTAAAEASYGPIWNNTSPTATHFTVGSYTEVNDQSYNYAMMLFASVEGISKVGTYNGTGVSGNAITDVGFSPRFLLIKRVDATASWYTVDTLRGFSSGTDKLLYLDLPNAEVSGNNAFNPTSTGFTVQETWIDVNANGGKYIYYAHA